MTWLRVCVLCVFVLPLTVVAQIAPQKALPDSSRYLQRFGDRYRVRIVIPSMRIMHPAFDAPCLGPRVG